ncbi:hypothetical protein D1007_14453 [Hordeum vulgare]|nr:hypothetical protein D1007_14453 [Hordeum vulgare]
MAEAVDNFFSHLLGEAGVRDFTLNLEEIGMPCKVLDHLDRGLTEEEVLTALVAKGLAIRLTEEMPDLVGAHQSAFIKGIWLHDNYMMVQGMARKLHVTKKDAVMLKLDITKAFNTVNRAFLLDVLRHMGFGVKWTSWIAGLLASSSTTILLNGIPAEVIYKR